MEECANLERKILVLRGEAMKWIKFSERWPTDKVFLLYSPSDDCMITASKSMWFSFSDGYVDCNGNLSDIDVEHDYWMPLPDKPVCDKTSRPDN
jgi:hypothetical protein